MSPDLANHSLAVLREAVSNVVRHANAKIVSVTVVTTDRLRIEVEGVGLASGRHVAFVPTSCCVRRAPDALLGSC